MGWIKSLDEEEAIPNYYHRDLHQKLQTLIQGNMSIEGYFKEMEMVMMRANIQEDLEATMAGFLNGLRLEIVERVEL